MLNLALNARDAMRGSGRLTIETVNAEIDEDYAANEIGLEAGQYILLTVSDTGRGMSAEQIDRAFEPFFTTKEVGRGSGLGLSMVYGFAKGSGGHASIYSELGVGTTVNLYLPKDTSGDLASAATPVSDTEDAGAGEVVLVVEDDERVRRLSIRRLKELGYTALEAADGPSALKVLEREQHIDLLFTDLVMPGGISGYELGEKVRELYPGMAILLTSGYTEDFVRHETRDNGHTAILRKPYRTAELAKLVKKVLASD